MFTKSQLSRQPKHVKKREIKNNLEEKSIQKGDLLCYYSIINIYKINYEIKIKIK